MAKSKKFSSSSEQLLEFNHSLHKKSCHSGGNQPIVVIQ
jgi:hypothetical protein